MNKYSIILSDPPWSYNNHTDTGGGRHNFDDRIEKRYPVMSFKDIYKLPVSKITEQDCLLFLWVTSPNLKEGIKTGEEWGFKYITIAFVWDKIHLLPGNYTMPQTEICLLFKKGKIPQPRGERNIKQFLSQRRTKHSAKPLEIKQRITKMFPTQKKIELFAREKTEGWDIWGNELTNDIELI